MDREDAQSVALLDGEALALEEQDLVPSLDRRASLTAKLHLLFLCSLI